MINSKQLNLVFALIIIALLFTGFKIQDLFVADSLSSTGSTMEEGAQNQSTAGLTTKEFLSQHELSTKAMSSRNLEQCQDLSETYMQSQCVDSINTNNAIDKNDPELCMQVQDEITKSLCQQHFSARDNLN